MQRVSDTSRSNWGNKITIAIKAENFHYNCGDENISTCLLYCEAKTPTNEFVFSVLISHTQTKASVSVCLFRYCQQKKKRRREEWSP